MDTITAILTRRSVCSWSDKPALHKEEDRKPLVQMVFYETFGKNKK